MIHIIYMAAGNSRRFGSNKLFYELDGKPMYRHLLDRLTEIKNRYNKSKSDSQTIDITVVTRYREILDYCACIPDCHAVISPDSEKGISYTIKAGIMAVQEQKKLKKSSEVTHHTAEKEEYYMFAVADQPYLKSQSVIKLIDRVLKNTGGKRLAFSLRCGDAVILSEGVEFARLGLAVVDEQHRFGVRQRGMLAEKAANPHLLVMSATPIPRTLGLLIYGDLDISILDELPPGRKPVKTRCITGKKRRPVYDSEQSAGQF